MPRRKLTVGLVQMRMTASTEENLTRALDRIERAYDGGAELICLPELFTSPYFPQYRMSEGKGRDFAESIPGRTTEALCRCAAKLKVGIIAGSLHELCGKKMYNTSPVIGPDGCILGLYRKTHIPYDESFYEKEYFAPGDTGFKVFELSGIKFGVLICYDQWFPEAARCLALQGAEIVFYPTAIGTCRGIRQKEGDWHQAWENVMRGHAIANGIVVCAVNRCGQEDRMRFWGGSFVCDAFGRTIERLGAREEVLVRKVDLDHGAEVRRGWGFLRNRRPECYGRLVEVE
ncbi:MAG: carbon-nitrogen hydrolase [Methanomassiliicoccales archaeon]